MAPIGNWGHPSLPRIALLPIPSKDGRWRPQRHKYISLHPASSVIFRRHAVAGRRQNFLRQIPPDFLHSGQPDAVAPIVDPDPPKQASSAKGVSMKASCGSRILLGFLLTAFIAPAFPAAQINWVKDFDAALKQASKENKFIVLDMSASW